MLHITEDTPPDMLAGAMDLTVHLPNGRNIKMAVERSTPMMDLLVQITTNNHLQLSNHTLQVLGMAPSVEHSDKVLPFKPSTPIGALDTQHIKVLPKGKSFPAPKHPPPPGHQPFESTFRLKVHLPRNQLYVTRVSRNVFLEDIMKKVCAEKNLDPMKFEIKHPGNLDETLDPKLTLSDYQITEIYLVHKGTSNLSQALSSTDIMSLRKEEERKQMHTKTGGGVFNLIFKRNKSSTGSGSISSDTRSLSPTHSDDSRSVTPPSVQAPPIVAPPKREPPERPKPPQRKRRLAPPPPPSQPSNREEIPVREDEPKEKTPSEISKTPTDQSHSSAAKQTISENGLTICHSRNSSDSSGYHEASILSDHNTSLPRTRPKSAFVTTEMQQMALAGGSNLSKMAAHSRSATSLIAGRKKKAPAPPPPPTTSSSAVVVPVSPTSSVVSASSETPSPLVASQTIPTPEDFREVQDSILISSISNPQPLPRKKIGPAKIRGNATENTDIEKLFLEYPKPKPRKERSSSSNSLDSMDSFETLEVEIGLGIDENKYLKNKNIIEEIIKEKLDLNETVLKNSDNFTISQDKSDNKNMLDIKSKRKPVLFNKALESEAEILPIENKSKKAKTKEMCGENEVKTDTYLESTPNTQEEHLKFKFILGSQESNNNLKPIDPSLEEMLCSLEAINTFALEENVSFDNNSTYKAKSNNSVSHIQRNIVSSIFSSQEFLKETRPPEIVGVIPKSPNTNKDRKLNLGQNSDDENKTEKVESVDEMVDLNHEIFENDSFVDIVNPTLPKSQNTILQKNLSTSNLKSFELAQSSDSVAIKKWGNTEKLHDSSLTYVAVKNDWVTGDGDDTESVTSCNTPLDIPYTPPIDNIILDNSNEEEKTMESTDSGIAQDKQSDTEKSTEDLRFNNSPIILEESPKAKVKHVSRTDLGVKEEIQINTSIGHTLKNNISNVDAIIINENDFITNGEKAVECNVSKTFINSANEEVDEKQRALEFLENKLNANENLLNRDKAENINVDPVHKVERQNSQKIPNILEMNPILSVPIVDQLEFVVKPKKNIETQDSKNVKTNIKTEQTVVQPVKSTIRDSRPTSLDLNSQKEADMFEIDWQYQLPSPPTAFRDSPTNLIKTTDCDILSTTDFQDSVVTQPELFEKFHNFDVDNGSETETLKSDGTSVDNEEILNTLSLEHLEKRKSLVYNRELATSLKMTDNTFVKPSKPSRTGSTNTLPNFKITTYDVPKQKIKVFEDDTIRSNVNSVSNLRRSNFAQSMENVSTIRPHRFLQNDEPKGYNFFRPKTTNYDANAGIQRSESFFTDRSNYRPVSRSQSHLTLNPFKDGRLEKSNSTMDVSELQSIGVMRRIQNRLGTPTSSLENLSQINHSSAVQNARSTITPLTEDRRESHLARLTEDLNETEKDISENQNFDKFMADKIQETEETLVVHNEKLVDKNLATSTLEEKPISKPEKRYRYTGPPTISMATWSERPKVPVHVREDPDYKLGNHDNTTTSKLIVNTTNNNVSSNNTVEFRNARNTDFNLKKEAEKSSAKNVIEINAQNSEISNKQFTRHFEANRFQGPTGYRKPFQNINHTPKQRPHSIAFGSNFDISRVPVVRSVELKKPYKDIYTSVTHINPKNDSENDFLFSNNNNVESKYTSTDNLSKNVNESKVFRVTNFQAPPVVKGFRTQSNPANRFSWNTKSFGSNTLHPEEKLESNYNINQHVPFSQSNLKRTDSNRVLKEDHVQRPGAFKEEEATFASLPSFNLVNRVSMNSATNDRINKRNVPQNYTPPPPPPPQMPSVMLRKVPQAEINSQKSPIDARDMLMDSIRSFGGKKGLKSAKS